MALASIMCSVRVNGHGVNGVTVRLVPDEALAEVIKPVECVSNAQGTALFAVLPDLQPENFKGVAGMQYGLYRVEVSRPSMKLAPAPGSRGRDIDRIDGIQPVVIDVVRK